MSTVSSFTEELESRTLMSVSGDASVSKAVINDRVAIRAELLKFNSDLSAKSSTLLTDLQAMRTNGLKNATTIRSLVTAMQKDVAKMKVALKADRLDESSAVLADEATILRERAVLIKTRGKAARAAVRSQIRKDHIQLQKDEIAGLTARIDKRQADYTTIFNDGVAISTALAADTTLSAGLVAAVNQWGSDRTSTIQTISDDLANLKADRTQLVMDLSAITT